MSTTAPTAPSNPVPAPQTPVQQQLGSGVVDTTDRDENELFGPNEVVAFDREEDAEPVTPAKVPALAQESPKVAPTAPQQQAAESVQQVTLPVEASAAPIDTSPSIAPAATPPPTQADAPPAVPTPPPAVAAQPPQAVTPQQVAPAAPAPQAPPAAQQPAGFAEMAQQLQTAKTQVVDMLAQQAYGLTPEEAEQIATDPVTVIPKMMARVHVNAVSAVLSHVAQQLPQVILGVMQQRDVNARNEEKFFAAWPQLKRDQHGQAVASIARVYRQMNPNADTETFIKQVGAQAVVALGLLQPGVMPVASAAAPVQRPAPFVPAAVSAPATTGMGQQTANPFEVLSQLMLNEDS